jgi:hypothetical protein
MNGYEFNAVQLQNNLKIDSNMKWTIRGVYPFIGTNQSGPVPKAFVYWYGWDRTVQLVVRVVNVYSGNGPL